MDVYVSSVGAPGVSSLLIVAVTTPVLDSLTNLKLALVLLLQEPKITGLVLIVEIDVSRAVAGVPVARIEKGADINDVVAGFVEILIRYPVPVGVPVGIIPFT